MISSWHHECGQVYLLDPVVQLSRLLAQQSANQNSGSGHMSIVPSRSPQGGSKPVGHPNTANSTVVHYMQHLPQRRVPECSPGLIWSDGSLGSLMYSHFQPHPLLPLSGVGRYSDFTITIIVRNSITVLRYYWNSAILIQKGADPSRSETPWVKTSQIMYEDISNLWW